LDKHDIINAFESNTIS